MKSYSIQFLSGSSLMALALLVIVFAVAAPLDALDNGEEEVGIYVPSEIGALLWRGTAFPSGYSGLGYSLALPFLVPNVPLVGFLKQDEPFAASGELRSRSTIQYLSLDAATDASTLVFMLHYVAMNQSWATSGLQSYAKFSAGPGLFTDMVETSYLGGSLKAGGGLVWVFRGDRLIFAIGPYVNLEYGLWSVDGSVLTFSGGSVGLSFGFGSHRIARYEETGA